MSDDSGSTVVSTPAGIEFARIVSTRGALKLETRGLKRRGTSARVLANAITGKKCGTAVKAYAALNAYIVATYGEQFDRPLAGK